MVTERLLAKMVDVGEDLRPRKRLRLDRTLEDNTYLITCNKSCECNPTDGVYTDAAPGQEASRPAPAAISNIACTENVNSQTWSYGTTHTTASETCITHSTTTVQSTVAKYVRPTLTPDGPRIDAIATSGYDLGFSEVSSRAEICFGAVGYLRNPPVSHTLILGESSWRISPFINCRLGLWMQKSHTRQSFSGPAKSSCSLR